jgi:hypothetical protein
MSAIVWLEDLEVDASHKLLEDRVRAVVKMAVKATAPKIGQLWG